MKGNEKLRCSKLIHLEKFSQVLDLLQCICMLHNKLRGNLRTLGSVITKMCLSVAKLIKCFSGGGDMGMCGWGFFGVFLIRLHSLLHTFTWGSHL